MLKNLAPRYIVNSQYIIDDVPQDMTGDAQVSTAAIDQTGGSTLST
jgi:hypothetical protein